MASSREQQFNRVLDKAIESCSRGADEASVSDAFAGAPAPVPDLVQQLYGPLLSNVADHIKEEVGEVMRSHGLPAGLERLEQECEKHGVTNGGKLREDVPGDERLDPRSAVRAARCLIKQEAASRAEAAAERLRTNLEEEIKTLESMRQRWRALTEEG